MTPTNSTTEPASPRTPSTVGLRSGILLLLVVTTFLLFWSVRTHEFVNFDDPDYVSANPMVQAGLTAESVKWAFTEAHSSNWHPVTWISHMLDCQWFGLNAGAHHLVSAAFHAINAGLLFLLLAGLTGATWRSAMVAGLFALHPLHVESVAWVSERKDVLSALFGLLTLLAYGTYAKKAERRKQNAETGNAGKWIWYGLALALYALGLMSKPMLVTWAFVMLLLDYWPLQRFTINGFRFVIFRRLVAEKIPFFLLALVSSWITVRVQHSSGATVPLAALPMEARVAQAVVSYARYLAKTFWPENLAAFYPYTPADWDAPLTLGTLVALAAITAMAYRGRRQHPYWLMGWLWFLGTLVPVIGLVQVGRQSIADRYTYLPHIGLFIAIIWGGAAAASRFKLPRIVSTIAALSVLTACGLLTARQIPHWQNTLALAQHATTVTRDNYIAHAQIASSLVLEGRLDEAAAECQRALEIRPAYAEAQNTLGSILVRQGRLLEALEQFQAAARNDPSYPDAYHGLADTYIKLGRFAEAEEASHEALRRWPMHLGALYTLAVALHNQGKLDDAITTYRRLLDLKPGLATVHRALGGALVTRGKVADAIPEFERALEIQPQNADAHNSLGMILLAQNSLMKASNHFSLALSAQPTNAIANYQIALLLTAAGKPKQALPHYRVMIQAQPEAADVFNNLAWLLATCPDATVRDGAEAVRLGERACALTQFKEPLFVGTLAAAYAEAGRFPEAVATAEKAIALAETARLPAIVTRNLQLLELYRAGRAFHEPPPSRD